MKFQIFILKLGDFFFEFLFCECFFFQVEKGQEHYYLHFRPNLLKTSGNLRKQPIFLHHCNEKEVVVFLYKIKLMDFFFKNFLSEKEIYGKIFPSRPCLLIVVGYLLRVLSS